MKNIIFTIIICAFLMFPSVSMADSPPTITFFSKTSAGSEVGDIINFSVTAKDDIEMAGLYINFGDSYTNYLHACPIGVKTCAHYFSHTYSESGTYIVKAKARDIGGQETEKEITVVIQSGRDNPPIITSFSKTGAGSEVGDSISFFVEAQDDIEMAGLYINFGDSYTNYLHTCPIGVKTCSNYFSHTYSESGTYIVKAKARDIGGQETELQTTVVIQSKSSNSCESANTCPNQNRCFPTSPCTREVYIRNPSNNCLCELLTFAPGLDCISLCESGVCASEGVCAPVSSGGGNNGGIDDNGSGITIPGGGIRNPLDFDNFSDLIGSINSFIFTIAIVVAPVLFIIAGFMIITAGGNPLKIQTAQKIMLYTAIGLAVILLAQAIISVLKNVIGVKEASTFIFFGIEGFKNLKFKRSK